MKTLLKAARIPKENRVEVMYIQLTNVARICWQAKEVRHQELLILETFVVAFHARFFHASAKREMRKKFLELQ